MREEMPKYFIIVASCALIFSGFFLLELIGFLRPNYLFSTHYISELGADGAPYSALVNWAGFFVVSISLVVLILNLWRNLAKNSGFLLGCIGISGVAIAYMGAFIFPCDSGCPAVGSTKQAIHNMTGIIEYFGGMTGLLLLAYGLKKAGSIRFASLTILAFICMIIGFSGMLIPEMQALKGAWQRLADYSFFIWLIITVFGTRKSVHTKNVR